MEGSKASTLLEAFAENVGRFPEKPALVVDGVVFSFGDLETRSNELLSVLQSLPVKEGERIAILLPNGLEFVVATLAAWKSGGILLPLSVQAQLPELSRYFEDCEVRTAISNSAHCEGLRSLPHPPENFVVPHANGGWFNSAARPNPGASVPDPGRTRATPHADSLAITFYSTGSTGPSKRLSKTHRQIAGECRMLSEVFKIGGEDRILGALPLSHAFGSAYGLLLALSSGATLYAFSDFFPREILRLIDRERITFFVAVPFMFQHLSECSELADVSSLRHVITGAGPLTLDIFHAFKERFGIGLCQAYGSSETGAVSANLGVDAGSFPLSCGFPYPGVTIRVIDDGGGSLPVGEQGQIAIHSPFAASCYDKVSAEGGSKFKDGAFLPGDLGYFDAKGRLFLSGRLSRFINVVGNKVDPTEVEEVIRKHPAVLDVAVIGVSDSSTGEKVKAIIQARKATRREEIISHCRLFLSDYKCPSAIEFRDEIPKSALGKVLTNSLLDREQSQYGEAQCRNESEKG